MHFSSTYDFFFKYGKNFVNNQEIVTTLIEPYSLIVPAIPKFKKIRPAGLNGGNTVSSNNIL